MTSGIFRFVLNVFSSSELSIAYFIILTSIVFNNTFTLVLFFTMISKSLLLFYPKKLFSGSSLGTRPKGGYDCNLFSCGGKPTTGGIISGHMTDITMLMTSVLLLLKSEGVFNKNLLMLGSFMIVTTGISRYLTNCHTLFQIFSGIFVGLGLGFGSFKLQSLITNDRFNNDKKKVFDILKMI